MRRAIETAPELYDGGVDWEGTYVDPVAPNVLSGLPPAILNFADYTASGFDPDSKSSEHRSPPSCIANASPTRSGCQGCVCQPMPAHIGELRRPGACPARGDFVCRLDPTSRA